MSRPFPSPRYLLTYLTYPSHPTSHCLITTSPLTSQHLTHPILFPPDVSPTQNSTFIPSPAPQDTVSSRPPVHRPSLPLHWASPIHAQQQQPYCLGQLARVSPVPPTIVVEMPNPTCGKTRKKICTRKGVMSCLAAGVRRWVFFSLFFFSLFSVPTLLWNRR